MIYRLAPFLHILIPLTIVFAVAIYIFCRVKHRGTSRILHCESALFSAVCVACIFAVTIGIRDAGDGGEINLVPFNTIMETIRHPRPPYVELRLMAENVILFIPFGFVLRYTLRSVKMPLIFTGIASLALSLIIEITQHITSRGMLDVDDLIANFLGGITGAAVMTAILFFAARRKTSLC